MTILLRNRLKMILTFFVQNGDKEDGGVFSNGADSGVLFRNNGK